MVPEPGIFQSRNTDRAATRRSGKRENMKKLTGRISELKFTHTVILKSVPIRGYPVQTDKTEPVIRTDIQSFYFSYGAGCCIRIVHFELIDRDDQNEMLDTKVTRVNQKVHEIVNHIFSCLYRLELSDFCGSEC